jgi:hypothetical protein
MTSTYTQEITQLMNLILKQNSFSFQNTTYIQKQGLGMGAPTSSILSEIFLQYMEHTKLVDILIQHQILGNFRYVDDVLLVYDATLTDIHTVLNNFNDATSPLQFTLEEEVHQQISFLDINIYSDTHHFTYGIYLKHTATATIIPMTSCHPSEHKRSTIRYLQNSVLTYPISEQQKQQEIRVITHILHHNGYPHTYLDISRRISSIPVTQTTNKKWAKFTYMGKETRFITKILKKPGLHIAYTAKQTIGKLLTYEKDHPSDKYENSGVYMLSCLDCHRRYVGQTGRSFCTRFKEHAQDYRLGNRKFNFAKHLIDNQHAWQPIEDSM